MFCSLRLTYKPNFVGKGFAGCKYDMNRGMRKPAFCICENKGVDQRHGDRAADQRHCLSNIFSSLINPKLSANFCCRTARFVSNLVGNPEDRFSHDTAHIYLVYANL